MVSDIDIRVLRAIDILGGDRVFNVEQSERVWQSAFPTQEPKLPTRGALEKAALHNARGDNDFYLVALQGLSVEEMWKFDLRHNPKHSRYFFATGIKGRLLETTYLSNEIKSSWATWKYSPTFELIDFAQHTFELNANMVIEAAITVAKGDPGRLLYPLGMRQHPTADVDSKGRQIWVGNQSPSGLTVNAR